MEDSPCCAIYSLEERERLHFILVERTCQVDSHTCVLPNRYNFIWTDKDLKMYCNMEKNPSEL